MNQKTEETAPQRGDFILEWLERAQVWFETNWKALLGMVLIALVLVFAYNQWTEREKAKHAEFWNQVSKLTAVSDREDFLRRHPDDDFSVALYLTTARQELDEKRWDKALEFPSLFLTKYPKHPLVGDAQMLKAYACEELGKTDEAIQAYQAAEADLHCAGLAKMALGRLQPKK